MKNFYLVASILGFFLPYGFFIGWLQDFGPNPVLFVSTITQNPLSLFAWFDVIITALVLLVFIIVEGRKLEVPRLWVPLAATCLVGPSFGLPLFLYQRQCQLGGGRLLRD